MPAPTEHDDAKAVKIWEALRAWEAGNATAEQRRDIEWRKKAGIVQRTESGALGWDYGALQQVQANLLSTKYPSNRLRFVKGKVEETLGKNGTVVLEPIEGAPVEPRRSVVPLPHRIALLRLDTDWYESTRIELEVLWPRLVTGGLMIVDDYHSWGGARRAVDEWISAHDVVAARDGKPLWKDAAQTVNQVYHIWKVPPFV